MGYNYSSDLVITTLGLQVRITCPRKLEPSTISCHNQSSPKMVYGPEALLVLGLQVAKPSPRGGRMWLLESLNAARKAAREAGVSDAAARLGPGRPQKWTVLLAML